MFSLIRFNTICVDTKQPNWSKNENPFIYDVLNSKYWSKNFSNYRNAGKNEIQLVIIYLSRTLLLFKYNILYTGDVTVQ